MPSPGGPLADELRLQRRCEAAVQETFASLGDLATNEVLVNLSQVVGEINGYVEHGAPWTLAKDGRVAEMQTLLYHAAEALRLTSVLLWPFMPERMSELWRRLGWEPSGELSAGLSWGALRTGTPVATGPPLFPKDEQAKDVVGPECTTSSRVACWLRTGACGL